MINSYFLHRKPLVRRALIVILAINLLMTSGCSLFGVKRQLKVPPVLPVTSATTAQLISEINRMAAVRSIRGKVDIQFEDTSFAESGIADKYRTADGSVILQRPGQVYLSIQAPLVGTKIAEMTSDGEHFRVAVMQGNEKFRRFVRGTNSAVYPKLTMNEADGKKGDGKDAMNEQRAVGAISNLRPQHLTDALLMRPVEPREKSGYVYSQSEFYQEEPDTRPRANKNARVVRGYYLLEELAPGSEGGVHLLRRFWFDRVEGIRLARLQTFDDAGALVTDIAFSLTKNFSEDGHVQLPSRVEITRPQDRYKLSVTYQSPESVVLDHDYQPDVFVLENKLNLPEFDLDARERQRMSGK